MLSLEEIQISTINPLTAREAYSQAEKRLMDILDIKKAFEQKAFSLLNAYIVVATGLFGVMGFISKGNEPLLSALAFIVAGSLISVGAAFLVWALLDKPYGSLGSDPNMWLTRGTIDGDDQAAYRMLAYITFYYQSRIDKSVESNRKMAEKIRVGVFLGVAAPIAFVLVSLVQNR